MWHGRSTYQYRYRFVYLAQSVVSAVASNRPQVLQSTLSRKILATRYNFANSLRRLTILIDDKLRRKRRPLSAKIGSRS